MHPLELINLAKISRLSKPKLININNIQIKNKQNEHMYNIIINKHEQKLINIEKILKPLQEEYNREMLYREEMKKIMNGEK